MYRRIWSPVAAVTLLLAGPANADANMDVIGHYYLQGVMETGSELLLMPDGRFQWYISYGAVDQNAEGTWSRDKNVVTLKAQGADRTKPLFRLDEQVGWDASTEQALLDRQREAALAEVQKRCPLQIIDIAASPLPFSHEQPDKAVLDAKADASLRAEKIARDAAEKAAAEAISGLGKLGSDERLETARTAIGQWQSADYDMSAAFIAAGREPPARSDLRLPAACDPPPQKRVEHDHPDLWQGGIVISIADPEMGIAPKGVNVTLSWADGYTATTKTASRGWAVFPKRTGVKANRVGIDPPFAPWGRAAFDIPPIEQGLQAFVMDARQVMPAPFETMALRIEGDDLLPTDMGRGRYVRGERK